MDDVRRLASLSRLTITRPEEERLRKELSSILEYFRIVDGVSGPQGRAVLKQDAWTLRRDEPGSSDSEGVLKGVPHKRGRLVRAPRVF